MAEQPLTVTKVVDACSNSIGSWASGRTMPPVLYHLSDQDGAKDIVSTKTLRASLATTLNDSLEVRYGTQLAETLVRERLAAHASPFDSELLQYLLDPTRAPPGNHFESFPFVVSLCGRCDGSGQWLHYGRSGRGVALGFDPSLWSALGFELVEVDYSEQSHRVRMAGLIEAGARLAVGSEHDARLAAHIVSIYVPLLAVRLKHPSFREEDEWRLLATRNYQQGQPIDRPNDQRVLEYRWSSERLVPYETLSFGGDASLMKEVVVGFSSGIGTDAFRLLLLENGLSCPVRRSEVPVR